jgi:hypothetical protein
MRRTSLFLGALLLVQQPALAQVITPPPSTIRTPSSIITRPGSNVNLPTGTLHVDASAATPADLNESLVNFDPTTTQAVWSREGWKLMANGTVLKDFGKHESDARQALRLIQQLGVNQYGRVGTPAPVMEYWLRDGQAPLGIASGTRLLALDAPTMKAEQSQGQWVLRDKQRVWFTFGTRGDDAQLALGVMQKYGFTQVGLVGAPAPAMMVLTANPNRPGSGAVATQAPRTLPADPNAALAGAASAALPALRNVAAQPNQPAMAFRPAQTMETLAPQQTSYLRGAPPTAPGQSDRVTFDYRQVQARQDQGHWKLMAGTRVLADFGSSEQDAKAALKAVQYYRLTEQHLVGGPTSHVAYYLSNGQPPHGIPFGVSAESIDRQRLTVQQVENRYAVLSGSRPLMYFGDRPDDARHVADVIQRYQFDHVCHVGPEESGLTVLVREK